MIASEVIISTRRYDQSLDSNLRVKFPNGLCLRPIISNERGGSMSESTVVRLKLDTGKVKWENQKIIKSGVHGVADLTVPYSIVLSNLTASLDVNVYYSELGGNFSIVHTDFNKLTDVSEWLKDITYANYQPSKQYSDYIENNAHRIRQVCHNGKNYGFAFLNTMYVQSTFFDVTTIGGLSNFVHNNGPAEYVGCFFAEPKTARRDAEIDEDCRTEWANEQYQLLKSNGLSEIDRRILPYVLGKYSINMVEEMFLRIINRSGVITTIGVLSLIDNFKTSSLKLVLGLSSFSDDRLEYYIDYERSIKHLANDEQLLVVETNSDFLNFSKYDQRCPMNIYNCLLAAVDSKGYTIRTTTIDNKIYSPLVGLGKALIISVT